MTLRGIKKWVSNLLISSLIGELFYGRSPLKVNVYLKPLFSLKDGYFSQPTENSKLIDVIEIS